MARFCPGMTLHKPIRTDAGHATLQDLRQGWMGGGWVQSRHQPSSSPSFRIGQTARDVSKLPTSHGDAEEKLRPASACPRPMLSACGHRPSISPDIWSLSAFRPLAALGHPPPGCPCRLLENIPATQWRDTETPQTVLSTSPSST